MGRTLRAKRGVVTNMVGAELFRKSYRAYEFDGTSMVALMAGWAPLGLPHEVGLAALPTVLDGTIRRMYSAASNPHGQMSTVNEVRGVSASGTGLNSDYVANVGSAFRYRFTIRPEAMTLYVSGAFNQTVFPQTYSTSAITAIGGRPNLAQFFSGPIADISLRDYSPMQDTSALICDGVRSIDAPPFIFDSPGTVKLDAIYADGVFLDGSVPVLTGAAGILSGGANVSSLVVDGAPYDGQAMAPGQHFTAEFDVAAGTVSKVGVLGAAGAVANLKMEAGAEGVLYKINEGVGLDVLAWTVDGVGREPLRDATIAPDADWQYIPDNTRYYPMNEGDGDTFKCYDRNGSRVPSADATIQNYNPDNWRRYPE